ncbi:MAG: polyprenyl synthetase family protein [Cyclobacteriaceae bacterium]|nr:polyprenyl synthetase family protein [Cyclobacteriaceae bacterium]
MSVDNSSAKTIARYQQWVESYIARQRYGKDPASLYEPIRYIMQLGGKRLRPLLVLLSYALFRDDVKKIVPYAVAVELFHNFTLVHDDIMDQAPLRRGKPTVHEKWNVSTAILSGDVMLVKVYDLFLQLPPKKAVQVLNLFNTCATQVCEGQQLDMEFESLFNVTEKEYIGMIRQKTAALLGFSMELGGCLAGTSASTCKALRTFGINMGIGFQLMDDLLDAYGNPEKFGKQIGGDIIANKKTYLLIRSLAHASPAQRAELEKWLKARSFDPIEKVQAVKKVWDELHIQQATQQLINTYFNKAFSSLNRVKGHRETKEVLYHLTGSLINRQQ